MTNNKKTLFSGIQPTGEIHIGNYLGALKNWVELQDKYNALYCIVDLHALTIEQNPKEFGNQVLKTAIDLLAIGLDPKNSIVFIQSQVKQHAELAWFLNTLTPMSELERMTQFKDKSKTNQQNINVGLFDYPVLMAADILLYNAEHVPVGEDQVQHIELTNTILRKFNNKFGQTFNEVKPLLTKGARIMSLTNPNKKMSKSLGEKNYIALRDEPEIIKKKIAKAVTDEMGVHNIFELLSLFSDAKTVASFDKQQKQGTIKYSEMKEVLANEIIRTLKPIQDKIKAIESKPKKVLAVLEKNAKRAAAIAENNMQEIKKKMGLL